jgi:hypothetical protein
MQYNQQSLMSDPGQFREALDGFPTDLLALRTAVQGLYIHYRSPLPEGKVPAERYHEVDTRLGSRILQRLHALDSQPLHLRRPVETRFIGCCRDAALLLCAVLRHQGRHARLRAGFARYMVSTAPDFKPDHVVVELHDGARWHLIDPERAEQFIEFGDVTFDSLDVPRDLFLVAGEAWWRCRHETDHYDNYGMHPDDTFWRGQWAIRSRMLDDLAMLNRAEYLLWDGWGLKDYADTLDDNQLALLDQVAEHTRHAHDDAHLPAIALLFQHEALHPGRVITTFSPIRQRLETITIEL